MTLIRFKGLLLAGAASVALSGPAFAALDGHDWNQIYDTLQKAQKVQGKPVMIVAHTLKGKGHTALENRAESHYLRVADAQAREALMEIMRVDGFEWPPR